MAMYTRDQMLEFFLREAICSDENLCNIGENISPFPEIKIVFEQYGLNDDDEDITQQCYSIYIHSKANEKKFKFPKHESSFGTSNSRPTEEAYFRSWYDNYEDSLSLNDTDEAIEDSECNSELIDSVITKLYKKYT